MELILSDLFSGNEAKMTMLTTTLNWYMTVMSFI